LVKWADERLAPSQNTKSDAPFHWQKKRVENSETVHETTVVIRSIMKLGTKIILAAAASITAVAAAALLVQRSVIRNQGIELTRNTMRTAILEAENVRESISALAKGGAFDQAKLVAEYKKSGDLRNSQLYKTVPVVAAWKAIEEAAKKEGYEFRVPKHQARNPKNNPTPDEDKILKLFDDGKIAEYFNVDADRNEIVYARPITLSSDCLLCHGDPKHSASGDGKDIVGFPMENWKVGDVRGAFVLKAPLDRVDAVVKAGMGTTFAWVLPISALIMAGFWCLNRCQIIRPLHRTILRMEASSNETTAASRQIANASTTLAEGASEQAASLEETSASLEETSASLEELTSMVRRNAESAQQTKSLAAETRAAADAGSKDMVELQAAIGDIKASSANVAKIVKNIDEIAFQTNILALNAAVEAARAGEAGAGFSVVADEVRNLAQRSAAAAKETAEKIQAAIEKSQRGVEVSEKVTRDLEEMVGKVRQVDTFIAEIATASNEQAQGLQQVNTALSEMDKVTQSNAATAEESASAAEQLNAQAAAQKDAVVQLLALVGGQGAHTAAGSAQRPAKTPSQPAAPSHTSNGSTRANVVARRTSSAPSHSSGTTTRNGKHSTVGKETAAL
jgi:methyl-accepting chemotaxis protein